MKTKPAIGQDLQIIVKHDAGDIRLTILKGDDKKLVADRFATVAKYIKSLPANFDVIISTN